MEEYLVKDLMVPLSDYATVNEDASLFDAVSALETAQKDFDHTRYRHRAILVLDKNGIVIGKLSHLDMLTALEPRYRDMDKQKGLTHYGFSKDFIELTLKENILWDTPLEHICEKIIHRHVIDFMHTPKEDEYVTEETSLDAAIHQLIIGRHQSLLVTRDDMITGVLRLSDVFSGVLQIIKECKL